MGVVLYKGKKLSDNTMKGVLTKIAATLGSVHVTSADRNHVPKGGAKDSLHLQKQAVDFGIQGYTIEQGFKKIYEKRKEIFGDTGSYEIIYHGKYTKTGGKHIHIGRFSVGKGLKFYTEGVVLGKKGYSKYP